ncbi:GOLPH3/VPS74 family protein [Amycolatopsis sp. H20-H5]|uniref:GOLPH3/VPS74 family protein n=1 Tax=Amycolatopsis sp. H20-H5 TaxID=3046309 RepID=UPI002DB5C475|nr:GPP34 family phosphoprotein [Amycolatopsis sp. H20-H5]MEC3977473.1 GPP34 family phosphoprotein [Amycolatopsis sp. H20-H5]
MTEMSLPDKAYLLACDVENNRLRDRQRAGLLIRAAALTDLLLRGRIADENGRVVATGGTTGDLVLDELLAEIAADRHRKWKALVRRDARSTLQSVEAQLEAARVIELDTSRILGLFPRRRPAVLDVGAAKRLHALVEASLDETRPVSEVDPVDASLTALVAAIELNGAIPRGERRRHKDRIKHLEERGGAAVPALRRVFKELRGSRAAIAATQSGGGG